MEKLVCKTRRFSVTRDSQHSGFRFLKDLTIMDISQFNEANKKSWSTLLLRHDPDMFSLELPSCLLLESPNFIVTEHCKDEHQQDSAHLPFFFNILPIVEEYVIAILLEQTSSHNNAQTDWALSQMRTGVRNPVTQMLFSIDEVKFFCEVLSENINVDTPFGTFLSVALKVSNAATTLSKLAGLQQVEEASWIASQALYWFTPPAKKKDVKVQFFVAMLEDTLRLMNEQKETEVPELFLTKLAKIWGRSDLFQPSHKIVRVHSFISRLKTILKPFINFIITFSFWLPNTLSADMVATVSDFVNMNWLFVDSYSFVIGQLFGFVLPLKERNKGTERRTPFQPLDFQKHYSISSIRMNLSKQVQKTVKWTGIHTKEYLQILIRDTFNRTFLAFLNDNWQSINPELDPLFQSYLLFDTSIVRVKYKKRGNQKLKQAPNQQKSFVLLKRTNT